MNIKRERCDCGNLKQKRKKYCEPCQAITIKRCKARYDEKCRIKKRLNFFYKNIRINLIQSPYLVDRKDILLTVLEKSK